MTMDWLILLLAGVLEIVWAIGLKYSDGFSRPWTSAVTIAAMALSLGLLGIAMRSLPVGTAYAAWVGVGVAGTFVLGIVLLDEPLSALRVGSVVCILAGIVGLKLATPQ
jgi:quaternary ammonium compound-resistance protein SugE